MLVNATSNPGQWQRIIAVGPGVRESLARNYPQFIPQIECIENSVPVPAEIPRRPRPRNLRVICVGRLEQRSKNVHAIPRIVRLVQDAGTSITLDVVGDGPEFSTLESALDVTGIAFRMLGRLKPDQALSALNQADVLLLPSFYEGMPIALLEAMARGVVPVASRLRGSTDHVIDQGVNGFLVDSQDDIGFAEAIVGLASDMSLLDNMSRASYQTAITRFDSRKMAARYEMVIRTCVDEVSRAPPTRSGIVSRALLGQFANTPYVLVRPWRRFLRSIGAYP